jgi:IclR family transcriptional regulator, KDG regulon repressor
MKALGLVEVISHGSTHGVGAMEAAAAAGLDKTTGSRLLKMLTEEGWLMRDAATRRYFPGPVLVGVARAAGLSERLRSTIDHALERLRDQVGETVALHQRVGSDRVCLTGFESREEIRTGLQVGDPAPLDRGASGKVILAFCEQETRERTLAGRTGAQRAQLTEQLGWIEDHGYLSTESDNTPGVGAVSVPVFDRSGVYGAVTIAGPASRFDTARRLACLPALVGTVEQVCRALGGPLDRYARWSLDRLPAAAGPAPGGGRSGRVGG